jgi:hypothetical protein
MKNILFGIVIALLTVVSFQYFSTNKAEETQLVANSALIQKELKSVGKLVVTEGHFSQVYNYKSSKAIFGNLIDTEKKALVVVNADVTIAYDLSKIEYNVDEVTKTLTITSIPTEELKVNPDFEYYDVQADYLNPFKAEDYNTIKRNVRKELAEKINASDIRINAKNRLISELSKFYILTNSLGWTLKYNETLISNKLELETLKL